MGNMEPREREMVPAANGGQEQQERRQEPSQQTQGQQGQQDGQQAPREPQGQQPPTQQRQEPPPAQTGQQPPATAQEARQQATQQAATSSAAASPNGAGKQKANRFADDYAAEVWKAATMSSDGIAALADLAGNKAMNSLLSRLRSTYGTLYQEVLKSFGRPGVIEKIAGIQSTNAQLYDDIIAETSAPQQEAA
jgi:hypothetical protein